MRTIRVLCMLAALLGPAVTQEAPDKKSLCYTHRKCRDCIRTSGCQWCADSIFTAGSNRCFEAGKIACPAKFIYPKKNPNQFEITEDKQFSSEVLFRPQHVKLKLHVGEVYNLSLTYRHARDYPVDLYYLMDLSASMEDDKATLSALGTKLADVMRSLTKEFRLGFGSFVDKVAMPYVSTLPAKLKKPCQLKSGGDCAPPYSYKNHLRLTNDTTRFSTSVNAAKVSGNLDAPEGGFDAIMQAILCQNEIGWRPKARHLLIFSTDADFHLAGDGRLAGLIEPNDMKCHMEKGEYTHALEFDYPSISQINQAAKKNNINLIFAVTSYVSKHYINLAARIEGASSGILTQGSSNVVQLVKNEYEKIVDNIQLVSTGDKEYAEVRFSSQCLGNETKETSTCDGLRQGTEVKFTASIKVLKCPEKGKNISFQIKPRSLEDNIKIDLDIDCDCLCERPGTEGYTPNSPSCNNHGDLQCGICACSEGYYGEECQCQKNSNNVIHLNDDACRMNNNTEICSGFGACECGVCTCITRSNPSEHYYGKFCECDNFTCRRHGGLPCAGPDHGTCECGQCICKWGWTGDACECRDGVEPCIKYGSEVCMGRGDCVCGACRCRDNYSGKYCDECPSCPGQQCEKYKDIVECRVFETGPLGKKEECFQDGSITIVKVDKIEEPEYTEEDTGLRICRIPDDAGCTFIFRYVIDNSTVEVQSTKECGSEINILALVLGVIGGIVLIGLLLLLIWKIVTSIHDRREYVKFEKERAMSKFDRGDNPIYKQATSTFNNPTFGGD